MNRMAYVSLETDKGKVEKFYDIDEYTYTKLRNRHKKTQRELVEKAKLEAGITADEFCKWGVGLVDSIEVRKHQPTKEEKLKNVDDADFVITTDGDPINEKLPKTFGRALVFTADWDDFKAKMASPEEYGNKLLKGSEIAIVEPYVGGGKRIHILKEVNDKWVEVKVEEVKL